MSCFVSKMDINEIKGDGVSSFPMLKEAQGCVNGCCAGVSVYYTTEYKAPGMHKDQEGFIVLEGTGWAKIGDEEFRLEPNISFIAPVGVKHSIKCDLASNPVKVFWFHAAAQ